MASWEKIHHRIECHCRSAEPLHLTCSHSFPSTHPERGRGDSRLSTPFPHLPGLFQLLLGAPPTASQGPGGLIPAASPGPNPRPWKCLHGAGGGRSPWRLLDQMPESPQLTLVDLLWAPRNMFSWAPHVPLVRWRRALEAHFIQLFAWTTLSSRSPANTRRQGPWGEGWERWSASKSRALVSQQ